MSQFRCVASSVLSRQRGLRRRIPCPSLKNNLFLLSLVSYSNHSSKFSIFLLCTKLEFNFLTLNQGRSLVLILLTLLNNTNWLIDVCGGGTAHLIPLCVTDALRRQIHSHVVAMGSYGAKRGSALLRQGLLTLLALPHTIVCRLMPLLSQLE